MPTGIVVNGATRRRPGVVGAIDATALAGVTAALGNVAVVGAFPHLEAAQPQTYNAADRVVIPYSTELLEEIARLSFSPGGGSAGASSLTLVNVTPCSAAQLLLTDAAALPVVQLTSRVWGLAGNAIAVQVATSTLDADGVDVTLTLGATVERYRNLQSGPVAAFYYDGADFTRTTLEVGPVVWTWAYEIDAELEAPGGAQSVMLSLVDAAVVGDVTLTLADIALSSAADVTVTLIGVDPSGVPLTVVKTATAGSTAFTGGGVVPGFGRVYTVIVATADVNYTGRVTLAATAAEVDCVAGPYATVAAGVAYFNGVGASLVAEMLTAREIPIAARSDGTLAGGLDAVSAVSVLGVGETLTARADLWAVVEALNGSALVSAAVYAAASTRLREHGQTPALASVGRLAGGAETPAALADWSAALEALEPLEVQVVVLWSESASVHALAEDHCKISSQEGGERCVFVGGAAGETLAQAAERTRAINSPFVALVAQEVRIPDRYGRLQWRAPRYGALLLASMLAGFPVGRPLTGKSSRAIEARPVWRRADQEAAIASGIAAFADGRLGLAILRSVTTYQTDDNRALSEVSTWHSAQTSVRLLRLALRARIGEPNTAPAAVLVTLTEASLEAQVRDGVILSFADVSAVVSGDTAEIRYRLAAVEPLNFAVVTAILI
jgi:hypothetical protein